MHSMHCIHLQEIQSSNKKDESAGTLNTVI